MKLGTEQNTVGSIEQLLEVAKQQKSLIWLILLEIIFVILFIFIAPQYVGSALWFLLSMILGIVCAYLVFKMGKALQISTLWLVITIILLFVPYLGIVPLLCINGKATKFLRADGVRVGLMGAKKKNMPHMFELK